MIIKLYQAINGPLSAGMTDILCI